MAVKAFQIQCDESDIAEGKSKAELAQAASSFLNTALSDVNSKSNLKIQKDKLSMVARKASAPGTVNNNLIVTDRNELLKMLHAPADTDRDE